MLSLKFKKTIKSMLLEKYNIKCSRIVYNESHHFGYKCFLLHCVIDGKKIFLRMSVDSKDGDIDESNLGNFFIFLDVQFIEHFENNNIIKIKSIEKMIKDVSNYFSDFIDPFTFSLSHETLSLFNGECFYDNGFFNIKEINHKFETNSSINFFNSVDPFYPLDSSVLNFNIVDNYIHIINFKIKSGYCHINIDYKFNLDSDISIFKTFFSAAFITWLNMYFPLCSYFNDTPYSELFNYTPEEMEQYLTFVQIQKI